jgi:thioredoxin-like negative regulator of GroEL
MSNAVSPLNIPDELRKGPTILDFYADWCQPCKAISKELERLKALQPRVNIVKINVDNHQSLVQSYEIKSIPFVLYYEAAGTAPKQLTGFVKAEEMIRRFGL